MVPRVSTRVGRSRSVAPRLGLSALGSGRGACYGGFGPRALGSSACVWYADFALARSEFAEVYRAATGGVVKRWASRGMLANFVAPLDDPLHLIAFFKKGRVETTWFGGAGGGGRRSCCIFGALLSGKDGWRHSGDLEARANQFGELENMVVSAEFQEP